MIFGVGGLVDIDMLSDVCRGSLSRSEHQVQLDGDVLPDKNFSYELYGVDNEFDLIEALYADWSEVSPQFITAPFFVERRIECAMNPEYMKKCLKSEAFQDVKDEILRRLTDA